ncbi:MAG: porphobilinogen synthase [Pseudomonadota bacterium]|nr:porphobilinogen synthase [Pseudomonadota bacterium]
MNIIQRQFPSTRLRRTRMSAWCRDLVSEHELDIKDLIWPIFVIEENLKKEPINSMPNVYRIPLDKIVLEVESAAKVGIKAIALFPVIKAELKDEIGTEALNPNNLICRTIKAIKDAKIDIGIITDVALDPYTTHGHDGIFIDDEIDNDATLNVLEQQALNQAKAGCDVIAPSDMQDGRVGRIREKLEINNFKNTLVLSYAAKFASNFYGPFRDAVDSANNLSEKDKKTYQQAYNNSDEALHEVALDIREGADIIMIKPAHTYLDIISQVKTEFRMPTFAYQVSGEYTMLELLAKQIKTDPIKLHLESLTAMKRAGADAILTYAAPKIANYLRKINDV